LFSCHHHRSAAPIIVGNSKQYQCFLIIPGTSDQLQVGQQGTGNGQLRGRQFDLDVRDHVRGFDGDPVLAQRGLDGGATASGRERSNWWGSAS